MARKAKKDFDYKDMNVGELGERLSKTQEELFKSRFRAASAPLKDTMQIRKLRREVARLSTFIHQKRGEQ